MHVKNGIYVQEQAKLTVWSQSLGKNMGELNVDPGYCRAAIGGTADGVAGPIIINGGVINSTSAFGARTIGAANGKKGGFTRIEINGGIVNAAEGIGTAKDNKRIGDIVITGGKVDTSTWNIEDVNYAGMSANSITISGDESRGDSVNVRFSMLASTITINSGKVEARGNPAIGPFDNNCNITINGGTVIAHGDDGGAPIGSGAEHDMKGAITINGGTVDALCMFGSAGAGIGAGSDGDFMGKVTISGGTVIAASTTTEREEYIPETRGGAGIGAGWAGNASKGTVTITGGTVTAIGTKGAAGIGGGMEGSAGTGGEGGTVRISGKADVTAISGAKDDKTHCSAIGHGHDDKEIGEVYIDGHLMVHAGDNQAKAEKADPSPLNQRDGMCKYRNYAHVQPCEHSHRGYEYDKDGHKRKACQWCGRTWDREPHAFLDSEKYIQCGYVRPFISVTFDANGGEGDMDVQKFFNSTAQNLNTNRFTWKDHTFRCWNTKPDGSGKPYDNYAEINPKANITLYAQWYTNVTLMGATTRSEWTGKPITGSGYKVIMPDRSIDTKPIFRGVSATRTETEAGIYKVEVKGVELNKTKDTTNTLIVTEIENGWLIIDRVKPTVEKPEARSLTYNGGTMMYSLDRSSWSESVPTATDAGAYTVWYKVAGDENHADTEPKSVKATIAKKEITVTADPMAKGIGEPDPELTYTVEGLVKGDKMTGHLTREKGEAWGGYRINLGTLSAGDNYRRQLYH